jgi:hypothetical protein
MRQTLEKTLEYGVSTFHLFIDFKAAYDTINRDKLLEAMEEFNIPQKLIATCKKTKIRRSNKKSDKYENAYRRSEISKRERFQISWMI